MRAIIYFTVGRNPQRMRIVIHNGEAKQIEAQGRDNAGDISWRPADNSHQVRERVLVRALLAQRTDPLLCTQAPDMLTVELGRMDG